MHGLHPQRMVRIALPMPHKISVRFPLLLGALLTILSGAGLYWINQQGNRLIDADEVERAETTADTAISSLKSIMLAGRGDTAHAWLKRISAQPSIDFARIYRPDGTEAFRDLNTVQKVNSFLAEDRFQRQPVAGNRHIDTTMRAAFDKVVHSGEQTEIREHGHLTTLYPIQGGQKCLACHGYTDNMLRGVLMLKVPTMASGSRMQDLLSNAILAFVIIILLFTAIAFIYFRRSITRPLMALNSAANTITDGDLAYRIGSQRKDEFGVVACAFDHLVTHLESRIEAEETQKRRQQLLTKAVISLSRQTAKETILHHVGELAMSMVQARYAMVTYTDTTGERHLIPLGISAQQAAAIAHSPTGEGLLGLLWDHHDPVRVQEIASHRIRTVSDSPKAIRLCIPCWGYRLCLLKRY